MAVTRIPYSAVLPNVLLDGVEGLVPVDLKFGLGEPWDLYHHVVALDFNYVLHVMNNYSSLRCFGYKKHDLKQICLELCSYIISAVGVHGNVVPC